MLLNLSPEMAATVLKSAPATRSLSSTMSSPAVNNCIVAEMREGLLVNPPTVQYIVKSVKYISLTLELATCTTTYFVHVIVS